MASHNRHIYSPLRYPGGKACIFPFVSKLFYENGIVGINYAEPYAGGCGLGLRLLFEGYVNHVYINDIDRSIYAIWHTLVNYPDEFCTWIEGVEVNMSSWHFYKEVHKAGNVNLFDLAKATFFLNRTNISGVIKGGAIGGLEQNGKYKIDARFNKVDLIARIKRISDISNRITISNLDGIGFIKQINRMREDVFIYLDPPYYCKGADLYMNFYKQKDHKELSQYVSRLRQKWMVSYDNQDFILDLYSRQNKIAYKLSQCASNRIGDEILIFSNRIRYQESMNKLNEAIALA